MTITLSGFATRRMLSRDVCPMYRATVISRAGALEKHAHESAIDRVLREPVVNGFLASLTVSPYTVKGYRGDILGLWNAAADEDLVPYPVSRRIRRPRTPELLIDCYTLDEARTLLAHAKTLRGCYPNGVSRRSYWAAAIHLAWNAGFRRGDCFRFRREAVRPDGSLRLVQHKTGQVVAVTLRPSTLAALDAIQLAVPLEWSLSLCRFGRHFRRLQRDAGVGRGTFKWLRRASGSYVEAQQPGAGHKHLGHADANTFKRHYDAQLGGAALPLPPEL